MFDPPRPRDIDRDAAQHRATGGGVRRRDVATLDDVQPVAAWTAQAVVQVQLQDVA